MFEEDSDALFDVFDSEVPVSEFTNGEFSSGTDHTAEKQQKINKQNQQSADTRDQSHKRSLKETEASKAQNDIDNVNGSQEVDGPNHAVKKFKLTEEAPQPIVADEFQQESTREVVNIPGLQSTAAVDSAAGITLSHQVCLMTCCDRFHSIRFF
jgi:ATP-dependent RNA helicase DOB1